MTDSNLGRILNADVDPSEIAIIDLSKEGPRRFFTYGELNQLADQVAQGLTGQGLAPGSVVAIAVENCAEHLATVFGIQRAGHVALPINYKLPDKTIEFVLRDSRATFAFIHPEWLSSYPDDLPKVTFVPVGGRAAGVVSSFAEFLDPTDFEPLATDPKSAAELLYTSGSTGRPKGVVLSHASHLWVLETRLRDLSLAGERALVAAPFFHMQGLTMSQLVLAGGGTLIAMPRFKAVPYIAAIDEHRPTWLTGVPPMMALILQEKDLLHTVDLSCVTTIRMGSAPVSHALLGEMRNYFPTARIINGYGTTESGPVAFGPHPEGLPTPDRSVGYPHWGVELRLSGPEPDTGELEIKSPGAMSGYLRRPELDPVLTPDGFYRTGDVFTRDENGFYYFVSRTDDMIVCGGENIYPSEVERVLEAMPGIRDAGVVAIPDEIKGQKPVAFVVLEPGVELSAETIQQEFLKVAPAYQYPRQVWFLDSMPITATNKQDRQELQRRATSLTKGYDRSNTPVS
jgi:long-chain acyl-CoA synthetase